MGSAQIRPRPCHEEVSSAPDPRHGYCFSETLEQHDRKQLACQDFSAKFLKMPAPNHPTGPPGQPNDAPPVPWRECRTFLISGAGRRAAASPFTDPSATSTWESETTGRAEDRRWRLQIEQTLDWLATEFAALVDPLVPSAGPAWSCKAFERRRRYVPAAAQDALAEGSASGHRPGPG